MDQRTLRIRTVARPGQFARVAKAIGDTGSILGDISTREEHTEHLVRDVTLYYEDAAHLERILAALDGVDGADVLQVIDKVFVVHEGGKLAVQPRRPIRSLDDLQRVYTPGVAEVCDVIAREPLKAYDYTMKGNTIAIVTNGTAVLGLGDIGPLASLPVMEGKAMLLQQLGEVGGFPILVDSHDPRIVIETVQRIAPVFGAIQLEDVAAPDCFMIEEALDETLDIPVMHDDQHGTATVALAGLVQAVKIAQKPRHGLRVVVNGAGAAGIAISHILLEWGVGGLTLCDSRGIVTVASAGDNIYKRRVAERANPEGRTGTLADALVDADVFIGVSRAGLVNQDMVGSMAPEPIVFPMANPIPEIWPDEALAAGASVAVDGRSLNNALAFPGIFRGALDVRATHITMAMKVAAAEAIAAAAGEGTLLPSILNMDVHRAVARAVAEAAVAAGVANTVAHPTTAA